MSAASVPHNVRDNAQAGLGDEAIALVRRWLSEAENVPVHSSARRLAGALRDPHGLGFVVGFVDGVVRPEDVRVAAKNLHGLAPGVPAFLSWPLRTAVRVGGALAPVLPKVVVPLARRMLRTMVNHLIIDADAAALGPALTHVRRGRPGIRLNINLLGEAVLGSAEAHRRLRRMLELVARPDVDYVSLKVSAAVSPHNPWAFDASVSEIVDELAPLFRSAAAKPTPVFINLDMEEYKDLDVTVAVFTRLLDAPELLLFEAGIVLQAYLPDALGTMMRLQEWSTARCARGGAPIKVRLVKGANLPMERVEAAIHGWPLATWGSKRETDTNYKRVVDYALDPERIRAVRLGLAGHNLFDIAYSWLFAGQRGVRDGIDFEMLLGMAEAQVEVVRREVGSVVLYTPVVSAAEFDVAISYLIRRLEEGASSDNFMSAVFELGQNEQLFQREKDRFIASLLECDSRVPEPHRSADRFAAERKPEYGAFTNTPDTDPAVPENRSWATAVLSRVPDSVFGRAEADEAIVRSAEEVADIVERVRQGAPEWAALGGESRARILHRAGEILEQRRADLIEVAASETGKTIDQADPEVSEAVDFAHYYAERARELDTFDGARFEPVGVTAVIPPWNFPLAITAGGVLAALITGSAVVLKPAAPAIRCGALIVQALWEAGVPRSALALAHIPERDVASSLVSHPSVDRVILTGSYETAALFRRLRPDLPLLAETSGKNAIIVTPSADRDLAVKDIVSSAFGHAGQKCSAASLVILVGSVAQSERFLAQLSDAVTSLRVGYPADASVQMGPLIQSAEGKVLRGLTVLEPGQQWLVEPKQLDESGRLWSPGIRTGVRGGSEFHLTEYFGPIVGVMTAATLSEAITLVNEVDYGLTSGLHSLDQAEIDQWLEGVRAGNLYVNRGTTGAIVQRQPFGGWKKSAVGPGNKAGGPNYLFALGNWHTAVAQRGVDPEHPRVTELVRVFSPHLTQSERDSLDRAVRSDALAWQEVFGTSTDVSALVVERNVFRYLPYGGEILVRCEASGSLGDLARVISASVVAGSTVTVSVASTLPRDVTETLTRAIAGFAVEDTQMWHERVRAYGAGRVRLIGTSATDLATVTAGRPDLAVYDHPVTESGLLEMLPFVREQSISLTAHRFGNPSPLGESLTSNH